MRQRVKSTLAAFVAAALAAAVPAAADWLVMRDGSRVESKGAWEVRGALVVLTLKNGALSSVRTKDVDLDASKAATEAAARPPEPVAPAKPAEPKKAVLTVTDADIGHVDAVPAPPPAAPAAGAAAGAAAPAKPAEPAERLVVAEWHQDLDASTGGATLVGQLNNVSVDLVQDVKLMVSLLDDNGALLADGNALVGATTLLPGQGTNFRVSFPGVLHFTSTKFKAEGYARKVAGAPEPET